MLEKIVSGGQAGADQAAWRAARAFGIATGGWMPLGFLTEEGPRPEFAELYGAQEMPTAEYPPRTRANVHDSRATVWFGTTESPGAKATLRACTELGKTSVIVRPGDLISPRVIADWILESRINVLNVAGNRESKAPGISDRVERFLCAVFRRLGHERVE